MFPNLCKKSRFGNVCIRLNAEKTNTSNYFLKHFCYLWSNNTIKMRTKMLPALGLIALTGCANKLPEKPNIIYLMFDDLGYGDLGCYGQKVIETPNIDALAERGIVFTDMYTACPISAPSRCSIITGKHTGHSQIRHNAERVERDFEGFPDWYFARMRADSTYEGQWALAEGTETIGTMMQKAGYTTGMIGKWGLGGPGSVAEPNKMGFDYFYGFNCQLLAHSYYPDYLWENDKRVLTRNAYMPVNQRLDPGADPYDIRSYDKFNQKDYSCDLMYDKLEQFVEKNAKNPFFLMWTTTVPHSTVQAPEEEVMYYVNKLGEEKTPITDGGWYYPILYPHSAYAAMITHIDTQVGKLVEKLKELGIYDNTLIIVTSDNGPACNSNSPMEYFESGGPFKCRKGWGKSSLHEGGIRMPFIVAMGDRLKGKAPEDTGFAHTTGRVSHHVGQFTDLMPTFAELAGVEAPENDGISFVPTLLGKKQPEHEFLYWEFPGAKGWLAVRKGPWKGLVKQVKKGSTDMELYNLETDPREGKNVAAEHPEIVKEFWEHIKNSHEDTYANHPNFVLEITFPE